VEKTTSVSIIIPVYNSVKYITEAVSSLLKQQFEGFEILLVDDGSTDGSGKLCDELSSYAPQVKTLHKKNGGTCSARNYGLARATGQYIMFCDNDDVVLPNFIADNYKVAQSTKSAVVRFGRRREYVRDNKIINTSSLVSDRQMLLRKDSLRKLYTEFRRVSGDGVWAGIYSHDFLDHYKLRFDEQITKGFEDSLFSCQAYRACSEGNLQIATNPAIYYVWRVRQGHSNSYSISDDRFTGYRKVLNEERQFMMDLGLRETDPQGYAKKLAVYTMTVIGDAVEGSSRMDSLQINSFFEELKNESEFMLNDIDLDLLPKSWSIRLKLLLKERYIDAYRLTKYGKIAKTEFQRLTSRID
jgi:glycosyltransferase involved in cell wall biosynthesis